LARKVEFGIRLPVGGPLANTRDIARAAKRADALGYDAVWVHDFIVWTHLQDQTHVSCGATELVKDDTTPIFFESVTNLAYLAGITEHVKLGVAVLCLPYRNPIVTAKQLANVDLLSNGRLILGVGPGGAKDGNNRDFEVLGIPRRDKWNMTKEYIRVMQEIWTNEKPSFDGTYIKFEPTDLNPKPVQKPHPPLWGPGHIWKDGRPPASLSITAELCDGWIPGFITPAEYPSRIRELKDMARAAGRGNVDFVIGNEIPGCIAESDTIALERSRKTLGVYTEGFQSHPDQERILGSAIVGSPASIREKVQAFIEAGVDHFEIKFVYHSVDELIREMELFAAEVIPAVAR
jgi:alkanesulfonate monooxygenase SsuD/methylene tetrahydromethanopterin reductase-like flavin-dependent oxidoreductase (luciferase family)